MKVIDQQRPWCLADEPSKAVSSLAAKKIFVTEKPQGFRVATDFFNDEEDIERLIESLA